jgi:hypothetical protein
VADPGKFPGEGE